MDESLNSEHDESMDDSCNPGPLSPISSESGSSASDDSVAPGATTPATEWIASADATPLSEAEVRAEFEEGIRKIVSDGAVVAELPHTPRTRAQVKLEDIGRRLLGTLDQLGRAMHKLDTIRKDRGAAPELTFDAAQIRRKLEADANTLMNEYVAEVVRQQGDSS